MKILGPEYIRENKKGSLIQLPVGNWKQCNILKIKKGHTFGRHYHKEKKELFYVLEGKIHLTIFHVTKFLTMYANYIKSGGCFLVEPYEKHIINAEEDSILVELLSLPYSEEDTFND